MAAPHRFGYTYFAEDFVYFYASGRLLASGKGTEIYDPPHFAAAMNSVLEDAESERRFSGPMEYWLAFLVPFVPLTLLPVRVAYYLWTFLSVILFAVTVSRLARSVQERPWPLLFVVLGFFPVIFGLLQGQIHGWQFLALTEFWLASRRQADRTAGLWLSLHIVKPQFLPIIVLYLAWHRRWHALGWFVVAGLFWTGLTVMLAGGLQGIESYIRMMSNDVMAPDAQIGLLLMSNWRSLAFLFLGAGRANLVGAITAGLTLLTVGLVIWRWRSQPSAAAHLEPDLFLMMMVTTLLIGYQTYGYSMVLFLPPALLFLVQIKRTSAWSVRFWSGVLDLALIGPGLLVIILALAVALNRPMPWSVTMAHSLFLLLGLIAILVSAVFLPKPSDRGRQEDLALTKPSSLAITP